MPSIVSNDTDYNIIIITLCRQTGTLRETAHYVCVFVAAPRDRPVLVDGRPVLITRAPSGGSTLPPKLGAVLCCRAYIFPVVIHFPIDVSAHAQ